MMTSLLVLAVSAQVATAPLEVLTLDAAVDTAMAHHPDLRAAAAQLDAARARVTVAKAPLLPQVDLNLRYTVSAGDDVTGFLSFRGNQSYGAGVGGSLLLWDFGRTRDRYQATAIRVEAQGFDRDATVRAVVLEVQLAYFDALAAKKLAAIARETLANEERHLHEIEAFVKHDARPEIDLVKARTVVAAARSQLIRADNGFAAARAQLAQAMGVTAAAFDVADEALPAVAGEDGATATLVDDAIRLRPELAALHAEHRAQELAVHEADHSLYPSLRLSADLSYGGSEFDAPGWGAAIGISLSWPIFDGGAAHAGARAERLALVVLDAQEDSLRQRVWLEIEQARLAVQSAKAGVTAAEESTLAARELLHLAERRYQEGVGSIIELADAQLTVTNASAEQVQAVYQLAAARARLGSALGS